MAQDDANLREEAADWLMRQRDPARADWEAFTDWLEADPAHNAAYEAVALADADFGEMLADSRGAPIASNDDVPLPGPRPRRLAPLFGAAAAVAAGFVAYPLLTPMAATYAIETKAGERRLVTLDDGTRIEINGDSRLTLRKGDNRYASLDRGEAAFTVVHDARSPFEVTVGDATLRDVGTIFNVTRTGDAMEAAVAEGAVLYNPDGEAVRLDAGKMIRVSASAVSVDAVDPASVGTWRNDRLVYQDVSLARIAVDLSRNLGTRVDVAPELANERFSGVIMLDHDRPRLFARVGALLDVDAVRTGHVWHLKPRKRAGR